MKKIAITVGSLLLFASLAACGSSNTDTATIEPAPVVTVTEQAPPADDTYLSSEDKYLADLHDMGNIYIDSTSDADLLEIGNTVCSALDEGNTIEDLITYLSASDTFDNTDQAEAGGMIIAAAVVDLCPEYTSQVQAYIS
jgi:hypothetical protein